MEFSSNSTLNASFVTASASNVNLNVTSCSNVEQFKINKAIYIREQLAELNSKDLRQYFQGIRKLYSELNTDKEALEIELIVHQEKLREMNNSLQGLNEMMVLTRRSIVSLSSKFTQKYREFIDRLGKEAPELAEKMEKLFKMQKRLAYLKFSKNFTILRDEARRCLRKGNYSHLMENYRKLLKIPAESPDYCMDEECRKEYSVKSASLAQFLQLELRSALTNTFTRIQFPFEESMDFNQMRIPLTQSAQILKCLQLVNQEGAQNVGSIKHRDQPLPLQLVLDEFGKRFNYHFYGERPTNMPSKPEWFFTQLSYWAENNLEYFEQHIQPLIDGDKSAKEIFLEYLMQIAAQKVYEIICTDKIVQDRRLLSHLIDECVLFEKEMQENFGYPEESPIHVVSEICKVDEVLELWIKLERDTLSVGVDAILADDGAYEPRYQEAADVDPYLVPNFADSFVILMQSMSERYRSIPDKRLQCRFLKLQLVVVDEFRSRIVQIGQPLQHKPWSKPYPQLMNALWYLTLVLDDWSDSPEFVRLQFSLQQSTSDSANSLVRGTFDEAASLYRHVWRQRVRNLCDAFSEAIRRKLREYADEKWYTQEWAPKPSEISPSLEPFMRRVQELLAWIVENVSPDSVLTLLHLTNHEVWSALDECVLSQTAFSYRGAAHMLHDITQAIIPLLNSCYAQKRGVGEFDVFSERCVSVLSTLRILALPPPTAILLKDELKHIPEQQMDEKLEQFNVTGMSKTRVQEVLEQRCDLVSVENLLL